MILIALGANLVGPDGTPEETLKAAMAALESAGIHIVARSSLWVTRPVPASDQPLYRNAVIAVRTELSAPELLSLLHVVEANFGRIRIKRNEARILDLDLIAYNDLIIHDNNISVPHPRMHERAFVLVPLCEIEPLWRHPVLQKTAKELLAMLPDYSDLHPVSAAA